MKDKKAGIRLGMRLIFLSCVTAVVELLLLNLGAWKLLANPNMVKNRIYTLSNCETVNWEEGEVLRSSTDPMLILSDVGCYVERLLIQTELSAPIPYIDLFYTNERYLQYGDVILRIEEPKSEEILTIDDQISDLRIDLGDEPGTGLYSFTVVVNPVEIKFSVPVVIAVLLIYLTAKFLFSLQETPDYGLEPESKGIKKREEGPH